MPAISIIIPAYNRTAFIAAAIGSVLRQTEKDFELIVWDDGSTDDTLEVARKAAGDDPRVTIVASEHRDIAAALNAAVKRCTGRYLGWVDSDDGLVPTALAETLAFLDAHPDIGMVYTDYVTMDETGRIVQAGARTKIPYSKDRLLLDFMTFHFRLMRRELFATAGGMDETLNSAEDYDFCLRFSEIAEIAHLARPLYLYRIHVNTISYARRLEQIMSAKLSIERALKRRGKAERFNVDVELVGRFRLIPKQRGAE